MDLLVGLANKLEGQRKRLKRVEDLEPEAQTEIVKLVKSHAEAIEELQVRPAPSHLPAPVTTKS